MADWNFVRTVPLIAGISLLLSACDPVGTEGSASREEGSTAGDAGNDAGSIWAFSETTDPFTDARSSSMTTRLEGEFALVDVVVTCGASGKLSYRFTTFDAEEDALQMSRLPSAAELQLGSNLIETISYRIRVDDGEPDSGLVIDPRHDNSFAIGPDPLMGGPASGELKNGDVITVGLSFKRGDDTILLDQTGEEFRSWVDRCGETMTSDREATDLSYQEQLHRNGDVDGRSKDYFTPDGDGEFGGAVVGMDYADFRDRLQFAGFSPIKADHSEECSVDPDYADCNYKYPETQSCSGTGQAFCLYGWRKGSDKFTIITRDGEGGQVVEMGYNR